MEASGLSAPQRLRIVRSPKRKDEIAKGIQGMGTESGANAKHVFQTVSQPRCCSKYCGREQLKTRRYEPGAPDSPPALRRCAEAGDEPTVTVKGDLSIPDSRLIGFFCSVQCPGDVILKTYDFARALRSADATIIGGFQSPMEKECLDLLLRGAAPVVVCPARGLGTMRIAKGWQNPLAEGRLLLLSFFDDSVRRATARNTARRNAYVAALADRIFIAHAEKGGKTETLCKNALSGAKPVFTLASADNAHLLELGARPVSADNHTSLLADRIASSG